MLKIFKESILYLLVIGALVGVIIKMVEAPDQYWVLDQINVHGGRILEVQKDRVEFRIGDTYVSSSWDYAEDYFEDLND